jgi:hypothetical protein
MSREITSKDIWIACSVERLAMMLHLVWKLRVISDATRMRNGHMEYWFYSVRRKK